MTSLVKQLDQLLEKHQDERLSSFVSLLGPDRDQVEAAAKELGAKAGISNVAICVPVDHVDGPKELSISPDADVTVMVYRQSRVLANFAYKSDELNDEAIAKLMDASIDALQ